MYRVMLVSHGELSKAILASAEMICGSQPDAVTHCLYEEDGPESLRERIVATLDSWEGEDILVLTDIRSGTPFNVLCSLMEHRKFRHISGMNLAMVIEALLSSEFATSDEIAADLKAGFPDSILDVNDFLAQLGEE